MDANFERGGEGGEVVQFWEEGVRFREDLRELEVAKSLEEELVRGTWGGKEGRMEGWKEWKGGVRKRSREKEREPKPPN